MLSNFPPGVSGNEFHISGPDREWSVEDWECPKCDYVGYADAWWHHAEGGWVDCPGCEQSTALPDDDGDDPDREYEARGDR